MKHYRYLLPLYFLSFILPALPLWGATEITQFGITWEFDADYDTGQFANGDYWVVGPVNVTGITNSHHIHGFTPSAGQDGSMINPPTTAEQGYDNTLGTYHASLKAWNHNALFDYVDRATANGFPNYQPGDPNYGHYVFGGDFIKNMWQAYRTDYGCTWTAYHSNPADPDDPDDDYYSLGEPDCSQCVYDCPHEGTLIILR